MNSRTTFNKTKQKTCSLCHKTMKNPYFCPSCDAPIAFSIATPQTNIPHAIGHLQHAQRELRVTAVDIEAFSLKNLSESLFTLANYLLMVENLLPHEEPEECFEEECYL